MLATTKAFNALNNWMYNVKSTGTFVKHKDNNWIPTGTSGIPSGWTVQTWSPNNLINFTIDGVSYQAQEGMTWGEWVNSEYNVNKQFIIDYTDSIQDTTTGKSIAYPLGTFKSRAIEQPDLDVDSICVLRNEVIDPTIAYRSA